MSLSMSVPERLSQRRELHTYIQYRRIIKRMGKQEFVGAGDLEKINIIMEGLRRERLIETGVEQLAAGEDWVESTRAYWGGECYATSRGIEGYHPVFLLAEHFMGNDGDSFEQGGYLNINCRGDALVVPGYLEYEEPWFTVMSFHKGQTETSYVFFPEASREDKESLLDILNSYETR